MNEDHVIAFGHFIVLIINTFINLFVIMSIKLKHFFERERNKTLLGRGFGVFCVFVSSCCCPLSTIDNVTLEGSLAMTFFFF